MKMFSKYFNNRYLLAAPTINVAGQLLSWGPFRKELLRWARKSDIITDVGDSATDTTRSELNSTKYSSSSQRTSTPKQDFKF